MLLDDFKQGFKLIDSVIMTFNKRRKEKIKSLSVVYTGASNPEILEFLVSHPLVKNIINVSKDVNLERENIKNISPKLWNSNSLDYYEKTKNSFFIHESTESALDKTYSTITEIDNFYPIVLIFSKIKPIKKKLNDAGFTSKVETIEEDLFSTICINKEWRDFDSYEIENFDSIREEKEEIKLKSNIFRIKDEGKEVPINVMKEKTKTDPPVSPSKEKKGNLDMFSSLPVPSTPPKLNKYNFPESKVWFQGFYEYLKDLMLIIFPEDRRYLIKKILTKETLRDYWIPSFTHKSANPNPGKNYELVEATGDSLYNYCFKFYLSQREPGISESRINNLTQKYASKDFQQEVSKAMKLAEWSISLDIPKDRMDLNEDLLEAFCGTLDRVLFVTGEDLLGRGSIIIYNLMKKIFDNEEFKNETTENTDPDVTYVQQYFAGPGFRIIEKNRYIDLRRPNEIPEDIWEKIVSNMNKTLKSNDLNPVIIKKDTLNRKGIIEEDKLLPDGKVIYTIKILKDYLTKLKRYGIEVDDSKDLLIGKHVGNTKKTAKNMAYKKAKQNMIDLGLTAEFRDDIKREKKKADLENLDKVLAKAKKYYPDIVEVEVYRLKNFKKGNAISSVLYQIIGKDSTGKLIPLKGSTVLSTDKNYEQGVINDYLGI